ncbi:MAG TPA: SAVMC3_10250 family protein [Streptosporangiaceae bacterium]|nr:SAVMC3_10250 family protein [Streptosporangiaceae bacterium]
MSRFGSRKPHPLHYYLYISDTKLDMLFDQIDKGVLKKISAEVKVDLKLASVTLREADDQGPTRMAKLKVVERYLDANHNVGTVQEPGDEYFRGQMDMQWGFVEPSFGDPGALFRGFDPEDSTCVVLVGSTYHVLGEGPPRYGASCTALPKVMQLLLNSSDEELPDDWSEFALHSDYYLSRIVPSQALDFLALPLAEKRIQAQVQEGEAPRQVHVILGTPLYVAVA